MSNPIRLHTNGMFATRETFDDAMAYAHELLNSISDKQAGDKIAALTALMVVVNTAAKVWPEAPVSIPAPGAVELELRLEALAARVSELEVNPVRVELLDERIAAHVTEWADDNFNNFADDWLRNHADLDNEIETWMENNMDIENEVREVLSSANLSITF